MACVMLSACAGGSARSRHGDLGFVDTETVGRARHAAHLARQVAASVATQAAVSPMVRAVPPALLALMQDHSANALEERLKECAVQAERVGNTRYFEGRPPNRAECSEIVAKDRCGKGITRAMDLGKKKHVLALECAEGVLKERWPAPFSIEQRYRDYAHAQLVETLSKEKEAQLIADGCTEELWGTLKPDIVLHGDDNLLKAILILDFKFPCPKENRPRWTVYGADSVYAGTSQNEVYRNALGGTPLLISPYAGVVEALK
jgi:hypothetical protein